MSTGNGKAAIRGVGCVVTWTARAVFERRDALEKALRAKGIKQHVKKTGAAAYLRRAIEQAAEDGLIRKIGEDEKRVVFAVVRERGDMETGDWKGAMREGITLHKETGAVTFSRGSELGPKIVGALGDHEGGLLGREVAACFQRVLIKEADAVCLRPGGGVLFVADARTEVLDRLDAIVAESPALAGLFHFNRFGVMSTDRTLRDVCRLYREQVQAGFEDVKRRIEGAADLERTTPRYYEGREKEIAGMALQVKRLEAAIGQDMGQLSLRLKMYARVLQAKHARAMEARKAPKARKK